MMCAEIYGARNIHSLTFSFSPSIVWFLANHHVFPYSHTHLFFYLLCSSLSHVISPPSSLLLTLCTLFSPSHSLEVPLFFLCILEVSTSFTHSLFHSSSLSRFPNKYTHTHTHTHTAVRVNETLMGHRLCLLCSQSLILTLQSKAHIRTHK